MASAVYVFNSLSVFSVLSVVFICVMSFGYLLMVERIVSMGCG